MRATAATVVGLLAGGLLGFLLRGLFIEEAGAREPGGPAGRDSAAAAAPVLPAPPPLPAEPLAPPAAPLALEPSGNAAADELIGILVYGAVLEPDGRPATLGKARWMRFEPESGEARSVEAGADSTYALSGLKPGRCRVSADFIGYRPYRQELQLDAAQPAVRLDIVLQPAVVLLVKAFTPSGEPLGDALAAVMGPEFAHDPALSAIATREPPPARLPEISYRSYDRYGIGRFSGGIELMVFDAALPKNVLGKLELDESLPAYVSLMLRHVVLQTQTVEPGATEVVFVVPLENVTALLGTVRVKVVDAETRQPVANARAELSDSQSGGGNRPPNPEGFFVWENQRPGLLELQIHAPGHETWSGEVSVQPGAVTDLGTLELTPATTLSGLVLDGDGTPVSVSLRALVDENRGLGMGARTYSQSGADGRFKLENLGRRRHLLVVSDEDWTALPVPVDLRAGDVSDVVVRVSGGTLVHLHAAWPAAASYGVELITQDGRPIRDWDAWLGDRAWAGKLAPADYVALVSDEGRELRRVPFTVGGEELTVELAP